jgi:hypothetical protein
MGGGLLLRVLDQPYCISEPKPNRTEVVEMARLLVEILNNNICKKTIIYLVVSIMCCVIVQKIVSLVNKIFLCKGELDNYNVISMT